MKIILVHNTYQQPGGEDVVFEQERQLLSTSGHEVATYVRSNHENDSSSLIDRISLAKRTIWASDTRQEFAALLRRQRPDVVHVHNSFMRISPSIYSACREAGVPVVQTLHNYRLLCPAAILYRDGHVCEDCLEHGLRQGVRHGCYRDSRSATGAVALMLATHRRMRTWTRDVNCYITLTDFARQKFIAAGFPADKIFVKPNFVAQDPGRGGERGSYALFVGRLSSEKGLATLFSAWEQLSPQIPLSIVGDGPMRAELEKQLASRNLPSICFRGRLPSERVASAIHGARFLIFPSEWYEGFPMTLAESFACGVPVICSRLGAMREIVEDGQTGLHFTPGDAEDLAKKVQWAWNHPEEIERMGEAARREYERKYTAEKNYPRLMEIYQEAISRNERRSVAKVHDSLPQFNLLGVRVHALQIPDVVSWMEAAIADRSRCRFLSATGMHGITEAQHDPQFKEILNAADLVVPDGMPLVWAARHHKLSLRRRVYGPELTETFCRVTGARYRHFFYGGAPGVAEHLGEVLHERYGIQVAGSYSPPFRPLTDAEEITVREMIESAKPDVLWVGLSTPKQERWMYAHRHTLAVPLLMGVGAAFDFHTGRVKQAPSWMQENGLEWLFRLVQEPRRLWRRYLIYGSQFAWNVSLELIGLKKF